MKIRQFGKKAYDFIMNPIENDARIMILDGSVRSGKTVSTHPKFIKVCFNAPAQGLGVITGVSKDTIYDNILRDLFDILGPSNYHYNRQTGDLTVFKNNPKCLNHDWKVIGARDEGSEKFIRGKTIANAFCDELSLMPENFFKQLLNRMSIEGAKLYGTTNPDSPTHWLYTDYMNDEEKLASGMVRVLHFMLDDNPTLSREYKDFIKKAYKGVFFKRFIEGLWVIAEGAIYKDCITDENYFDDSTIPKALLNSYVERGIAIDYGTTNPCIYLDIVDDGTTLWVLREYYWSSKKEGSQKTDAQYADDLERFKGSNLEDAHVILDPSAESFNTELRTRGIFTVDADNEVIDGIRMTATMFALNRIKIHTRNCPNLIKELGTYSWNDKKAETKGVEAPVKVSDHGPDALRYYIKTKINPWRLTL